MDGLDKLFSALDESRKERDKMRIEWDAVVIDNIVIANYGVSRVNVRFYIPVGSSEVSLKVLLFSKKKAKEYDIPTDSTLWKYLRKKFNIDLSYNIAHIHRRHSPIISSSDLIYTYECLSDKNKRSQLLSVITNHHTFRVYKLPLLEYNQEKYEECIITPHTLKSGINKYAEVYGLSKDMYEFYK